MRISDWSSDVCSSDLVGTRYLDWAQAGRGNYWSDNPAFDLDGDGIADAAYRPNDLVDTVLWTAPQAKLLINSPAVQVIRWAQSQFPALLPGGRSEEHTSELPSLMRISYAVFCLNIKTYNKVEIHV